MNLAEVDGRRFALLLIGGDRRGGAEQWAVVAGMARWDGAALRVERGGGEPPILLPADALGRVRPVPPSARETLLGAEYFALLSAGPLADDFDLADFIAAGLRPPGPPDTSGG